MFKRLRSCFRSARNAFRSFSNEYKNKDLRTLGDAAAGVMTSAAVFIPVILIVAIVVI